MKHLIIILVSIFFDFKTLLAQQPADTAKKMNMDAVYDRPFMAGGQGKVMMGGYAEANWQHRGTDGISEGHQFQFRRLTLFTAAGIGRKIRFMSELEIEDGGRSLAIEFAAIDLELHPLLNLRGGVILNPIGAFNQNHDGPKWEFTERPMVSTHLLPATWSNVGFGIFVKIWRGNWMLGYELYASGGFDGSIISNEQNKTYLPAAKSNPDRFESSASGLPLYSGKMAAKYKQLAEIGLSYMGGTYNAFQKDGLIVDEQRRCHAWAIDWNIAPLQKTRFLGEYVYIRTDIPKTYLQSYGRQQQGFFVDWVQTLREKPISVWNKAAFYAAFRVDFVDWNLDILSETGDKISDHYWGFTPALSFRPVPQTVFRAAYTYARQTDFFGNPPALTGGFQLGVSSYF